MPRTTSKSKTRTTKTVARTRTTRSAKTILPPKPKPRKPRAKKVSRLSPEELFARTQAKAYELFEKRGRVNGRDFDDWLEAERIVLAEA